MPYSSLLRNRLSEAQQSYALTFCVRNRMPAFKVPVAAFQIIEALKRSAALGYCQSLAWVVMPDHIHWLVTLSEHCSLSSLVSATKGTASRGLRRHTNLRMPIWQPGYYDHRLRAEEDLVRQARYLIANPLRAGLVNNLADYPYWYAMWAAPPHGPAGPRPGCPCGSA